MTNSDLPTNQTFHQFHDLYTELDLHRIMSGFHGAFTTGVASQQGTLTLPDTWFRPPFWDLLMLQLLRPNSSNLPCLYSTFHLEYPLVLSRFYFLLVKVLKTQVKRISNLVSQLKQSIGSVYVKVDFICMGYVEMRGTPSKRELKFEKFLPTVEFAPTTPAWKTDVLSTMYTRDSDGKIRKSHS